MRLWRRKGIRAGRDFIVSLALERHSAWLPVHDRGRAAPGEAVQEWRRRLRPMPEKELVRLIADNRACNRLLGKVWQVGKGAPRMKPDKEEA